MRLLLALLVLLAAPAAASGAVVELRPVEPERPTDDGRVDLRVTDRAGETNRMTVTFEYDPAPFGQTPTHGRIVVRDSGTPPEAGTGCERVDAATVSCPTARALTGGAVELGPGDDHATV